MVRCRCGWVKSICEECGHGICKICKKRSVSIKNTGYCQFHKPADRPGSWINNASTKTKRVQRVNNNPKPSAKPTSSARYVVCDYCGHVKTNGKSCEVCTTKTTSLPEERKFCAMENCRERISVKKGNLFCDLHTNAKYKKCSNCDIMVFGKRICDRCSKQKPSTVAKTSPSSDNLGYGRASCRICGNTFETYPATKAAQKAAGNALAWGGIGLTMLTGGLTGFVFGLMPGVAGGSLAGSAEVHTLCPKCR